MSNKRMLSLMENPILTACLWHKVAQVLGLRRALTYGGRRTIGFCRLSKCRPPAEARQATRGDGLFYLRRQLPPLTSNSYRPGPSLWGRAIIRTYVFRCIFPPPGGSADSWFVPNRRWSERSKPPGYMAFHRAQTRETAS